MSIMGEALMKAGLVSKKKLERVEQDKARRKAHDQKKAKEAEARARRARMDQELQVLAQHAQKAEGMARAFGAMTDKEINLVKTVTVGCVVEFLRRDVKTNDDRQRENSQSE